MGLSFQTSYSPSFFKVPKYISVFYFKENNLVVLKSFKKKRCFFLNKKLKLLTINGKIFIFVDPFKKFSKNQTTFVLNPEKKVLFYLLRQLLIETELNTFSKLSLKGVGFKVSETNYENILMFKLGYSHPIYFKLSFNGNILKGTKLLFNYTSYYAGKQLLAKVRSLKLPEIYKNKGVFYNKEKNVLKEGKKS